MNRRSLLAGLLATAAIPVIGPDKITRIAAPCYGLDVGGTAASTSVWLVRWGDQVVHTFIYGNEEVSPLQFSGFSQFADADAT